MELLNKINKGIHFLLCVIDIFSKYALVVFLKYIKGIKITDAFQKMLLESGRKPNKLWIDKGSEFYNKSLKSWLQNNSLEMYSAHNQEKFIVAERFIRTLKKIILQIYDFNVKKFVY